MNISLCLTTYQRTNLLQESFAQVIDHPGITEVVISDDHSDQQTWDWLQANLVHPKIKLSRNEANLDCYFNKANVLTKASNDWCILLDSDNVIDIAYVNRLESLWQAGLTDRMIYQPEWARPHFDFRHLTGERITKTNVGYFIKKGNTGTMLNAMNYFVNRHEYIKVFDSLVDPVTSDSIYQNHNWLKAGNSIYVVDGLQYTHRVHDGSHYQKNNTRTPQGFHEKIMRQLTEMK